MIPAVARRTPISDALKGRSSDEKPDQFVTRIVTRHELPIVTSKSSSQIVACYGFA
jgi:hypothetical protein